MKHEIESAFRREPREAAVNGNLCTRALTARTIASLRRCAVTEVAAEMWPNDRALQQLLTRAASNPAMTSVVGWAAELVRRTVVDAVAALGAASSAADVMAKSLLLDWDGGGIISAPGFVASANNSGFVAEGQPIPVRQLTTGPALLNPFKLASIAALTREMVESSNAEALISEAIVQSSGLALDAVFFSANAATAAAPAGIRNGIAALGASANADAFGAFFEDMATLLNAVGTVGGKGPFFIVSSIGRLASASGRYGSLKAEGTDATIIPLASSAVGSDIVVIAPRALVAALSADPAVETTGAATLVMDTAPGAAGTMGPEKEMYQSDSLAVKVRWPVTWALRDSRAVAWLTPAWK